MKLLAILSIIILSGCTTAQQSAWSAAGQQAISESVKVLGSVAVSTLLNAATQEAQAGKVDWQQAGAAGLWVYLNAQNVLDSAGRIFTAFSGGKAPLTAEAVAEVAQSAPANTQAGKAQIISAIATVVSTATGAPPTS